MFAAVASFFHKQSHKLYSSVNKATNLPYHQLNLKIITYASNIQNP